MYPTTIRVNSSDFFLDFFFFETGLLFFHLYVDSRLELQVSLPTELSQPPFVFVFVSQGDRCLGGHPWCVEPEWQRCECSHGELCEHVFSFLPACSCGAGVIFLWVEYFVTPNSESRRRMKLARVCVCAPSQVAFAKVIKRN